MKILLLGINLGESPISNLHLGYIAKSKKNFFRENGFEILTLNFLPQLGDIIFNPGDSIFDVINKLPSNWMPDLFLIQGPEYVFLPLEIHKCPFPIVFITCDFDYEIVRSKELMKLADSVVCFSEETERVIRNFSRHTIKFPIWFGYEPITDISKLKKPKERKIDIFYSGNMDTLLFPEKGKLIMKVIEIAHKRKLKIKINPSYLKKEEYENILSDVKICLAYHRRKEIQRPEAPLFGASLITNSDHFKEIYKENEDFFVYDDFDKLEDVISKTIEYIENSDFDERLERISDLRKKMLPHVRLLELIRKIQENIDEIEKKKNERLEKLKTKGKKEKENEEKIYNVFSIFPLSRIFPIPKNAESFMSTKLIKILLKEDNNIIEEEENNIIRQEKETQDKNFLETQNLIYSLKSFFLPYSILFLNEDEKKIVEEKISYNLRNPDDFQTPLNLGFVKILQGKYEEAYVLLELSYQRLLNLSDEEFQKIKNNIFILPAFPQLIPPPLIFPELKNEFFYGDIEKKKIENFLNFAKAVLLRNIPPAERNMKISQEILSNLVEKEANFRYLVELSKTLIKLCKINEACKIIKKAYHDNINPEIADILLSLALLNQEEFKKEEIPILKEYLKLAFALDTTFTSDKGKISKFVDIIFEELQFPAEKPKIYFIVDFSSNNIQDLNIVMKNIRDSLLPRTKYVIFVEEEIKKEIKNFSDKLSQEYGKEIFVLSEKDNSPQMPEEEDILIILPSSDILLKNTKVLLMFSTAQVTERIVVGKILWGGEIICGKLRGFKGEINKKGYNEKMVLPFFVGRKLKDNRSISESIQETLQKVIKKFLMKP